MSKTLETKKRILNLLKKREMTITELSAALDLSTATISQHMDELRQVGAVEKIDNEHYKKLKYYKINEAIAAPILAKYAIVAVAIILLAGVLIYTYASPKGSTSLPAYNTIPNHTTSSQQLNQSTIPSVGTGAFACPMMFYRISGTVTGYSGFRLYSITPNSITYSDYVIAPGSSGNLMITEYISGVLNESGISMTRQHYATLKAQGTAGSNSTYTAINVTITPNSFAVRNNETINSIVTVATNGTVANGTYALIIDGPCGPGVSPVLITIGSKPYNGTVSLISGYYA